MDIIPYPPSMPVIRRRKLVEVLTLQACRPQSVNMHIQPSTDSRVLVPNKRKPGTAVKYPRITPVHLAHRGIW